MHCACPTCGHECAPADTTCPACGASTTLAMITAVQDPEHSTAYAQLLEVRATIAAGAEPEPLWNELQAYLEQELERYSSFPCPEGVNFMHGLQIVDDGLRALLEAVQELRQGREALDRAREGDALLVHGREMLLEAHDLVGEEHESREAP